MGVLKDFSCGQLHVYICDTRNNMGFCAGKAAAAHLKDLLARKEMVNVMFAAAPSQNETLAVLCAEPDIDWARIRAFHMDEYVGLDAQHPAGFRNFLRRAIFDQKPFAAVYLLNGNAPDPQAEAQRYDALLCEYPLDMCILGVGENGHVAFNDPPVADFSDPVRVKIVELEERCRMQQVHDGCFATLDEVPTHALSATIPALMSAGRLFCVVPAASKAEAVRTMLSGRIDTACPASILTTHPRAELFLDVDSGQFLL